MPVADTGCRYCGQMTVLRQDSQQEAAPVVDVKTLHAKVGELTLENDFCPVRLAKPAC